MSKQHRKKRLEVVETAAADAAPDDSGFDLRPMSEPSPASLASPEVRELEARVALLTREQEVELASSIEHGETKILDAIAASAMAIEELRAHCEEVDVPAPEFSPRKEGERLSPKTTDHLLARLRKLVDAATPARRKGLLATISIIEDGRRISYRARSRFVEANMGLVVWMATKKLNQGLSRSDLIQEGSMGLMRAAEKFDHRRGIRFSTYAAWWVRHFMNRALSDQSRIIRVPVHLLETRHKLAGTTRAFRQRHAREPTPDELSDQTKVADSKIHRVLAIPSQPLSLDAPVSADSEARLGDFVADTQTPSAVDDIYARQVKTRLRKMLGTLTPREQEILSLRFGIDRSEALTLEQVGERFSLTRERIRQIEAEALGKLRQKAQADGFASA